MSRWLPEPEDVAVVHRAATEVEALAVEQALRSIGVRAWLRSRQLPGYGDVIANAWGVWGEVVVPHEDADAARALIQEFLGAVTQGAAAVAPGEPRQVSGVPGLSGVIPPLVTLFDHDGQVDETAMRAHVGRLIDAGVHAVFALGSTGEVMHLTSGERRTVAELVVEQAAGRVPVLIGCGGTATQEVITYARHAAAIGAAAAVVIVPYYWTLSDASVEAHFRTVAGSVDLPIIIYNFPAVSGRNLSPALIARLAQAHPNIAGIKETIDSIGHIQQVLAQVRPARPGFSVLCGYEYHLLNTLILGGDGAIPGMANVAPEPSVALYEAFQGGDLARAAALARERLDFPALYQLEAPLFVVVKEAMALLGQIEAPTVRLPALPLTDESRSRLRRLLSDFGLL